jgi:2-polyprenyl-3-methyl-5-hydroxy-6-metoxy-1,4-benzoquinol methylase
LTLVYPTTAEGETPVDEFACTTGALAEHDDIVQCVKCGMVSAVSTLQPDEIVDNYRQVVDETYLKEEAARRELFDWFVSRIEGFTSGGKRLLEVGSNVGLFLSVAAEHGCQARGIEPSKWAVEEGVARFDVDLEQGTVEDLDATPSAADVIVMLDVLEHLNDPLAALRKLRGMINEDGLLVLSTVNLDGLHARLREGNWPWFIRSHLHYFGQATLASMLRAAGFRMVEWTIAPRSFHLSYIAQRAKSSHAGAAAAAAAITKVFDPELPVGWLGDITFIAVRPDGAAV